MERVRKLKLVLCLMSDVTRLRIWNLLTELVSSEKLAAALPRHRVELVRCSSQDEALARLRRYAQGASPRDVILLSDALVEPVHDVSVEESWSASGWAKEVRDALGVQGVAIAVMEGPRRVTDIDRAISRRASGERLLETLQLAGEKLHYMARPAKAAPTSPIEVRLIRRQTELLEYYQLRHRIYKVMGYLTEEIENAPSQLEIDWCDTIALHCGAYELSRGGRDTLVGTARVVIGSSGQASQYAAVLARYRDWTLKLASRDPVLSRAMDKYVLGLELPIFQSQDLSGVFRKCILNDDICGELSRVIVAEHHRGSGLSRRLVEFALHESARAGVNRMFLECLELHEELYRKFGFQRMEGTQGSVIGVQKTMIAMELCPLSAVPAAVPEPSASMEDRRHV